MAMRIFSGMMARMWKLPAAFGTRNIPIPSTRREDLHPPSPRVTSDLTSDSMTLEKYIQTNEELLGVKLSEKEALDGYHLYLGSRALEKQIKKRGGNPATML